MKDSPDVYLAERQRIILERALREVATGPHSQQAGKIAGLKSEFFAKLGDFAHEIRLFEKKAASGIRSYENTEFNSIDSQKFEEAQIKLYELLLELRRNLGPDARAALEFGVLQDLGKLRHGVDVKTLTDLALEHITDETLHAYLQKAVEKILGTESFKVMEPVAVTRSQSATEATQRQEGSTGKIDAPSGASVILGPDFATALSDTLGPVIADALKAIGTTTGPGNTADPSTSAVPGTVTNTDVIINCESASVTAESVTLGPEFGEKVAAAMAALMQPDVSVASAPVAPSEPGAPAATSPLGPMLTTLGEKIDRLGERIGEAPADRNAVCDCIKEMLDRLDASDRAVQAAGEAVPLPRAAGPAREVARYRDLVVDLTERLAVLLTVVEALAVQYGAIGRALEAQAAAAAAAGAGYGDAAAQADELRRAQEALARTPLPVPAPRPGRGEAGLPDALAPGRERTPGNPLDPNRFDEARREAQNTADVIEAAFENVGRSIQAALADSIEDALAGGKNSLNDFSKSVQSILRQALSEAFAAKLVEQFASYFSDASAQGGGVGTGVAGSSGAGLGNFFGDLFQFQDLVGGKDGGGGFSDFFSRWFGGSLPQGSTGNPSTGFAPSFGPEASSGTVGTGNSGSGVGARVWGAGIFAGLTDISSSDSVRTGNFEARTWNSPLSLA